MAPNLDGSPNYLPMREAIVALGVGAVPQLQEEAGRASNPWQVRLMAGICAERIPYGDEIASLARTEWQKDPEYNSEWNKYRGGAYGAGLGWLIVKRYKERKLWYHCLELIWKETGEHAQVWHMREEEWRGVARSALKDSEHSALLVRLIEERIRRDLSFSRYETQCEFHFLLDLKTNAPLPFLLEIVPRAPVNDVRQRNDYIAKMVRDMAQPADVPLIEKYYRDRGEEVPATLRDDLWRLKERQAPSGPNR